MLECIAIITKNQGSLSTVVGDEKLTSREGRIGPLFMHVQSDEDTLLKVDKVSKTEALSLIHISSYSRLVYWLPWSE